VLGVVHEVLDDWSTWKAVLPTSQHEAIYNCVGKLFLPAKRYRGLRSAIAACYLASEPALREGYPPQIDRFHALWELHASMPDKLAPELPDGAGWQEFLVAWGEKADRDQALMRKMQARRKTLADDALRIRSLAQKLIRESGALERSGATPKAGDAIGPEKEKKNGDKPKGG
jgi:hypothetical protein